MSNSTSARTRRELLLAPAIALPYDTVTMGVQIPYMGAKHWLAEQVAATIAELPEGPCLDMFSGMCSVAESVAVSGRNVWCNDVQAYARLVAQVLTQDQQPPSGQEIAKRLVRHFKNNTRLLEQRFGQAIRDEESALSGGLWERLRHLQREWPHVGNSRELQREAARLRLKPDTKPFRLALLTYAHGFFGVKQAIELDSLRFAIHAAEENGELTASESKWCRVALLQASSHLSSSTGHFAQFLKVKDKSTFKRVARYRSRSPWSQFILEFDRMAPLGSERWRSGNRVFSQNALTLPKYLMARGERPAVVYADPPYSKAQYSRYYHVLESLARYDYPVATGEGRYRQGRFHTSFSLASTVRVSFESLIRKVARMGSSLVVSYPTNGLLYEIGGDLASLLRTEYGSVEVRTIAHRHSTLGASSGSEKNAVEEMIFVARRPKNGG